MEFKLDLVTETGIARENLLMICASIVALLEWAEAREAGTFVGSVIPGRRVLGSDIHILAHNRKAIEQHLLADRIMVLQSRSVEPTIVE